jgi:hypothetical protein
MCMRTLNAAWKAVRAICVLALIFQPLATAQQPEHDSRLDRLFSSDPAVSGAAKSELLQRPDPALLPALLKALPASQGTLRDDLLEILAKYDDPSKLPVFLSLLKPFHSDNDSLQIRQQLAHLGAPAAQAILAGCEDNGEGYPEWAVKVLNDMDNIGLPFIIEALLSDDDCRRQIGRPGLQWALGEADPNSVLNADVRLASDAATDPDEHIREAAKLWFGSWKGREDKIDLSGIVEALIAEYQSNAPPETMEKIAVMLSDTERPRVTRFMRAAVHAPNPKIQQIANEYLTRFAPKSKRAQS